MTKRTLYILLILDILVIMGITALIVMDVNIRTALPSLQSGAAKTVKKTVPQPKPAALKQKKKRAHSKKEKRTRNIMFQYRNSKPRQVAVLGEFNDWETTPMVKGKNHTWEASIRIVPGEYLYCFDVDGRLIPDPNNPKKRILSGNEKRSLLKVKPFP